MLHSGYLLDLGETLQAGVSGEEFENSTNATNRWI